MVQSWSEVNRQYHLCPGAVWASTVRLQNPWAHGIRSLSLVIMHCREIKEFESKALECLAASQLSYKVNSIVVSPSFPHSWNQQLLYACTFLPPKETSQPHQEAQKSCNINSQRSPHLSSPLSPVPPVRGLWASWLSPCPGLWCSHCCQWLFELIPSLCQKSRDGFPVPSWTTDWDIAPLNRVAW